MSVCKNGIKIFGSIWIKVRPPPSPVSFFNSDNRHRTFSLRRTVRFFCYCERTRLVLVNHASLERSDGIAPYNRLSLILCALAYKQRRETRLSCPFLRDDVMAFEGGMSHECRSLCMRTMEIYWKGPWLRSPGTPPCRPQTYPSHLRYDPSYTRGMSLRTPEAKWLHALGAITTMRLLF